MAVVKPSIQVERINQSRLADINFNELQFGRDFSDHMFLAEYENGEWTSAKIMPFGNLNYSPAACVFHYGQAIFEGLKAHRSANGEILFFRPIENWKRLNQSARRMCMAEVPEELFMEGLKQLVDLDRDWVPEGDGKSLYIRPFLIANDAFLGVKPSNKYQFIIITSPTSNYYSGAVKVKVEREYTRACEGGIGVAKAAANYAASLYPAKLAQEKGYHQLIWTDAKEHKYIEESGTMNIMFRIGDRLITPSLDKDTILPGITRKSVIALAEKWSYTLEERRVSVEEIEHAIKEGSLKEAFGLGTAATIAPISSIGIDGIDYPLGDFQDWEFANRAKKELEGLKRGSIEDTFGWTVKV